MADKELANGRSQQEVGLRSGEKSRNVLTEKVSPIMETLVSPCSSVKLSSKVLDIRTRLWTGISSVS
jgi:hypothetical protein